jgi:hypothetical protein
MVKAPDARNEIKLPGLIIQVFTDVQASEFDICHAGQLHILFGRINHHLAVIHPHYPSEVASVPNNHVACAAPDIEHGSAIFYQRVNTFKKQPVWVCAWRDHHVIILVPNRIVIQDVFLRAINHGAEMIIGFQAWDCLQQGTAIVT